MKRIILIATIAIFASMTIMASGRTPRRHKMPRPRQSLAIKMPEALKPGDKIAIISKSPSFRLPAHLVTKIPKRLPPHCAPGALNPLSDSMY